MLSKLILTAAFATSIFTSVAHAQLFNASEMQALQASEAAVKRDDYAAYERLHNQAYESLSQRLFSSALGKAMLGNDLNKKPVINYVSDEKNTDSTVIVQGFLAGTPTIREDVCGLGVINDSHKSFQTLIDTKTMKVINTQVAYMHMGGCE